MTKKNEAYREVSNAIDSLRAYRGLPTGELFNDSYPDFSRSATVKRIRSMAESFLKKIGEELPSATEKQISLLVKFSQDEMNRELVGVESWGLNKYQASELIGEYISLNKVIVGHYSTFNDIEFCEKRIEAILAIVKK